MQAIDLLPLHLQVAVPLRIAELRAAGGITSRDIARVQGYAGTISEAVLYRGGAPGETAEAVSRVVEGIAVLAFTPGGVTVLGLHFEA